MSDPGANLVPPGLPDESLSNGFLNPIDLLNYASPTAWINKGIEAATGFDVIGSFMEAVSGDWEAVWKFGEAMGHLADCMAELGINVQQGMLQVDDSWDGNAADAAYLYFSNLAAGISGSQHDFRQIEDDYQKAALGAWQLASQLGNILQAIVDAWLIGLAAAGAGAALSATGAGAVAGYAVAGVQAVRIAKLINDASLKINAGGTAIMAIFAVPMTIAYRGGDLSDIKLPAAAYTTPGA
ncbi:hypothetical protein KZ829_03110 [Actinoplanes hulinensis]|uniref:Uncharacterized protein n=1 Tax=Actinoplanes hulinensis TaxID=1144547 RepID=A0ABS7AX22_9ACTN|nr:hypothetical protein [Actinoplanes hulinensis]MBW6432729.1 hypothetical protein [Actinoplanes hulinensis]